ncbi:MAG: non-homologous end-joining DNA ligase [Acidimicrobiia bacterium]|nr:non-homologous end-joining DNA ligase [Acidimicrobiia bacterium]MDH5236542.1 non-homologous end-joining DNA ligase [Acidimicrobiia bacterium]
MEVGRRELSVSNLDKVLYPLVGFTKAQVIHYYVQIAPVMLPHVRGRGVTLRRWPDGVGADSFFEKRCPGHRPEWLGTTPGPGDRGGAIEYCCLDEVAALAWTANMAALEIHAPMARGEDIDAPTMVVFDLDPGEPATIIECCQVALDVADVLDTIGLAAWPKTSGSKGLQLYVPLNTPHTQEHAGSFAHAVAQLLEKQHPDRVLSVMTKKLRKGKVFIDWSQNTRHKTTIAPYSLRGLDRPTVSTPLGWDEVSDGADGEPLVFDADEVLERVDELGDLFEPTVTLEQQLPAAEG